MKKLQFRILTVFIVLFTLFSISIGVFSTNLLQDYAQKSQEEALIKQTKTIADLLYVNGENSIDLESAISQLTKLEILDEERLTVIDLSGVVVYDSAANKAALENHSDREEFQAVLNGEKTGISIRESGRSTLKWSPSNRPSSLPFTTLMSQSRAKS